MHKFETKLNLSSNGFAQKDGTEIELSGDSTISSVGSIKYAIDASGTYTNRSLTDKGYVDKMASGGTTEFELLNAWKIGYENYQEFVDASGYTTQVNYWSNSGKLLKLFTKNITYVLGNPTLIVLTDEITLKTLTTVMTYSGDTITTITKTIT